jgi:hypothetical protein
VLLLFVAEYLEVMLLDKDTTNSTKNWTKPHCDCLPGCNELSYSSSMSYGNIDPLYVKTKLYANEERNFNKTYVR